MDLNIGLDRLKSRYIIALLLTTWILIPELLNQFWSNAGDYPWYWVDIGYYYPLHLADIFFLAVALTLIRPDLRQLLGHMPTRREWWLLLHTTFLLFTLGTALIFAIYLPLSYLFPEFVQWWLAWAYAPTIYLDFSGSLPVIPNTLSWLSLVVIAPITEELLFRGFLLHRWAARWGMSAAIIASSLLFGIMHPDPLGATLFGVGMCLLYLHTRSLWVPIIAHAINNFTVWLWDLFNTLNEGYDYYFYDLEQFRDNWSYGIISAVAALVAAAIFLSSRGSSESR
ncbi:MAG TPA: CPBP family intramembrane glutamic endopeptidase [Gammaproteobacteria bacterium]